MNAINTLASYSPLAYEEQQNALSGDLGSRCGKHLTPNGRGDEGNNSEGKSYFDYATKVWLEFEKEGYGLTLFDISPEMVAAYKARDRSQPLDFDRILEAGGLQDTKNTCASRVAMRDTVFGGHLKQMSELLADIRNETFEQQKGMDAVTWAKSMKVLESKISQQMDLEESMARAEKWFVAHATAKEGKPGSVVSSHPESLLNKISKEAGFALFMEERENAKAKAARMSARKDYI